MRHLVLTTAALAALALRAAPVLAQTPPPPPAPPAHHGILGHLFHRPAPAGTMGQRPMTGGLTRPGLTSPLTGGIVGNKNTHVYHLPGDKGALPATQNRVYFRSAAQAEAAGFHRAGGSAGAAHHGPAALHLGHTTPMPRP